MDEIKQKTLATIIALLSAGIFAIITVNPI